MRNPLTIDRFHFYGDIHLKMESVFLLHLSPSGGKVRKLRLLNPPPRYPRTLQCPVVTPAANDRS